MSTIDSDPRFKQIDDALASYYNQLNIPNYYDSNGNGIFLNYIRSEELNDPQLPINNELGDRCNPYDCAYTWMNHDNHFPIPPYAQIPHQDKEAFMFYIMQYCYKHSQPPSQQYIQTVLIPKCNGTVNNAPLPTLEHDRNVPDSNEDIKDDAPMAFASNLTITNTPKNMNEISSSDNPIDEVIMEPQITRLSEMEFTPKYRARAHLNIFTTKELTKELFHNIEQTFENELNLYYYTDISTALQMNDKQMKVFKLLINDKEKQLSIINYDLYAKGQREEILYGIVVPNANSKVTNQDKWLWKVDEFLTGNEIYNKYKIKRSELPKSSREMPLFRQQLSQQLVIEETLIEETDWINIQQIKSLRRNVKMNKIPKITIILTKEMWITECKKSFSNVNLPLIPVVINKNGSHWIEWIKIVYISSQNMHIGVSLKYDGNNNKWSVESMCLDRGDVYNKHRLVGLTLDEYDCQFVEFKESITEIQFSDNSKDVDKKINVLKQQIQSQQDSILRLKKSLLRTKNANKYVKRCNEHKQKQQSVWDNKKYICEFMSDELENRNNSLWIEWIEIGSISTYNNFNPFNPIDETDGFHFNVQQIKSSKRNIKIPKVIITLPKESFSNVNKISRKFIIAIFNSELNAIIVCNGERESHNNKFDNKYRYQLNQINKYGLLNTLLKRRITGSDTKAMKEYCATLKVLDLENGNGKNKLIVNIIHRNCDVSISFRYDEQLDLFMGSAIYLEKGEIESKQKWLGLTFDYCKNLHPFSLRRFKFKSDKHSIIFMFQITTKQIQLKRQLLKHKNAFEREELKEYQSDQLINNCQTKPMINYQSYANQYVKVLATSIHTSILIQMYGQLMCHLLGFVLGWICTTAINLDYYIGLWLGVENEDSSIGDDFIELEDGNSLEVQTDWEDDVASEEDEEDEEDDPSEIQSDWEEDVAM